MSTFKAFTLAVPIFSACIILTGSIFTSAHAQMSVTGGGTASGGGATAGVGASATVLSTAYSRPLGGKSTGKKRAILAQGANVKGRVAVAPAVHTSTVSAPDPTVSAPHPRGR